jgi:cell wall-associated NlpC family hydrolase
MEEAMKGNHMLKKRVGIVLVFAMALSGNAVYTTMPQEAEVVSAGQTDTDEALGLTAGITDILFDTTVVKVTGNETQTVGAGQEEDAVEEKAAVEEISSAITAYENLGIAVVDGNLNVRKKASTSSSIIGKMTNHNACEILDTEDGWTKIKSGKVKGYVKSEYLVTGDEALELAKEEVVTVATVNTETLRVRKKASTDSKVISLVGEGEDLVVDKQKGDWYKVEVDDETGYVSADYVEISEKLPTATSVDSLSGGASGTRASLVQYALQFVGNPYVWGGTSLTNGVDCSGFTMQVYAHYGISLPHHAASQPAYGRRISASQAQPGDLFFYGSGGIGHVGIYIGNGQIVHASNPRSGIKISSAYYQTPVCVVSYLN